MDDHLKEAVTDRLAGAEKKLNRLQYLRDLPPEDEDKILTQLVRHHQEERDTMSYFIQNLKQTPRDTTRGLLLTNTKILEERLLKEVGLLSELDVYLTEAEIHMEDMSGVTDPNLV